MDVRQIAEQLNRKALDVARMLLPGGKKVGSEWTAANVTGEPGNSLKVHLVGNKAGVWCDFSTGESGDLIDLWMATKSLSLPQVIKEAKDYLGVYEPELHNTVHKSYRKPQRPSNCVKVKELSPVHNYLINTRKLTEDTLKAYQIGEVKDREGHDVIVFPFKRVSGDSCELVNIKYLRLDRPEGKKISWFEKGCESLLFGWQAIPANSRSLLLTEGEADCMTWHQYGYPAVSMPNGIKGLTWIENEFSAIEQFDTIYLSVDMDDKGRAGLGELISRLGRHRCRIVSLPYKDANECLQKGVTKEEMAEAINAASTCDPEELKSASVYVNEVIEEIHPQNSRDEGLRSPWPQLNVNFRFRHGEITIWTGFNGQGKTTLLNQVVACGMGNNEKACIASLEVKSRKLLARLTRQVTAQYNPHPELIRIAFQWYGDKLWIFDVVGAVNADKLLDVFDYARQRYGVTQFVIDSLMRCDIAEDDYKKQKSFVDRLVTFAIHKDCHVHLVSHLRKPANGKGDNQSTRMDVRGAGAITDLAHNVFIVNRNRNKEMAKGKPSISTDVGDEPDACLILDKQREGEGWIGQIDLWFDKRSLQYLDSVDSVPVAYVTDNMPVDDEDIDFNYGFNA